MENKLETVATATGKMVKGEEVNYYGLTDYCMVDYFHAGLSHILKHFVSETMRDGIEWSEQIQTGVYTCFDVLDDVLKFKEDYLKRRIATLENALSLCHNGDIDSGAVEQ